MRRRNRIAYWLRIIAAIVDGSIGQPTGLIVSPYEQPTEADIAKLRRQFETPIGKLRSSHQARY